MRVSWMRIQTINNTILCLSLTCDHHLMYNYEFINLKISLTPNLPLSNGEVTGHVHTQMWSVWLVQWVEDFHDRPWLTSRASECFVPVGVVDSTWRDVGGGTVKQAT